MALAHLQHLFHSFLSKVEYSCKHSCLNYVQSEVYMKELSYFRFVLQGYVDSISLYFHLHCACIALPWSLTSFLLEVKLTRSAAAAAGWILRKSLTSFLLLSLFNFLIQIKFNVAILALSRGSNLLYKDRGFVRNPDTQVSVHACPSFQTSFVPNKFVNTI